ncbi:MAG: ATP-binding cassette domain-containing protein [Candidatus Dadabacteria bacterium]|nr:ATP-binding cassette domain-containing protein [Candidatus Dadabacteria bacterium]
MLEVKELVKSFHSDFLRKKTKVLNEVTFDVREGEVFGFIGPNGAGKTTTFKSILGYIPIDSGNISIMNKSYLDVSVKSKIGYLPENPYFYDYLTGEELLRYMGNLHSINKENLDKRIELLLNKVKMGHARKMQLRKYSKGMLQRIGIAQALINDPDFLILDEPMSGLDPVGRREIIDLILEKKERGKTVILSSHILSDVETLCDRVGVIFQGKIVKLGNLSDLLSDTESIYEMILNNSDDHSVKSKLKDLNVKVYRRAGLVVLDFNENIKKHVIDVLNQNNIDIIRMVPLRKSLDDLFISESLNNIKIQK